MTRKCCIVIFLALFLLDSPIRLFGGSQYEGWSEEERALAQKLGLDLSFHAWGFRIRPVGEQTWLSEWVVEGAVKKIDNDPEGFWRTKVRFHVDRYLKGEGPTDITFGFSYGPGWSADHKTMTNSRTIPSVVFSEADVNKHFIAFLNRGRILLPSGEELYPRGKDEFNVANRYSIVGDRAVPDADAGSDAKAYPYSEIVSEIVRVAVPQAKLPVSKP